MQLLLALRAGLRLALLGTPSLAGLRLTPGLFWALTLAGGVVSLGLAWPAAEPPVTFNAAGLAVAAAGSLLLLLVSYLLARALGDESRLWPIAVLLAAAGLVVDPVATLAFDRLLPDLVEEVPRAGWIAWGIVLAWWTAIIAVTLRVAGFGASGGRRAWLAACAIALIAGGNRVLPRERLLTIDYYAQYREEHANDPPELVDEEVFASQPALLQQQLEQLAPQRPGMPDLYFVAFAPYGDQDVFMKEAHYSADLFRDRFGLRDHTLTLINNRAEIDSTPLASLTNLRDALDALGGLMDRKQDILFLFLTSHGSRDAQLSVSLEDLNFADLTAPLLADALRESGIRWKVILVSGCYSGSFIDALRDDDTLLMTAARADRTSFGCSDDAEFTYFGRAYFEQALRQTDSFSEAFARARKLVDQWETRDDYVHSEPQIVTGRNIEAQLARWRATLKR
jgi:hypothetical protein